MGPGAECVLWVEHRGLAPVTVLTFSGASSFAHVIFIDSEEAQTGASYRSEVMDSSGSKSPDEGENRLLYLKRKMGI